MRKNNKWYYPNYIFVNTILIFLICCIRWTNAEFKTFVCNEDSPQKTNNNNPIEFRLVTNSQIPKNSKLIIKGLVNTQTPDNPTLALTEGEATFGTTGDWTQASGELQVTLVEDAKAGKPYRFQVKLKNGKDLSPTGVKPTIQVGSAGTTKESSNYVLKVTEEGAAPTATPAFTDMLLYKTYGPNVPASVPPSEVKLDINFKPTSIIPTNKVIIIGGLVGSASKTDPDFSIQGNCASNFLQQKGTWDQSPGTLVLSVDQVGGLQTSECAISFNLKLKVGGSTTPVTPTIKLGLDGKKLSFTGSVKLGIAATFMKNLTKASAQSAIKVFLKKTVSTKAFYP